ncbi:MAG: hypothetical protein ACI4DP_04195 [Candidatus Ornithomonoglobus sp.]
MKKLLASLLAAALTVQCGAVCSLAAWDVHADAKENLCQTDLSGENELSTGWSIVNINNDAENNAYAEIATESFWDMMAPYLKIRNDNVTGAVHNQVQAIKEFTMPEGKTGVVRASFKYSSNHGNSNAVIRLSDSDNKGILIGSAYAVGADSEPVIIDGEEQNPQGNEANRIYVADLLGTGESASYALADGYIWDLGADGWGKMWRDFEIVANTSDKSINTTIAGSSITLGGGIYAVAVTTTLNEATTNILKGVLPADMGSFSKFAIESGAWIQDGTETRIDDLSIDFEPITYINDTEFANWKGVVWGEIDPSLTDDNANKLILSDAADMSDLGVGWTRFFVGQNYDQDRIESMIRAANEKGVKVLMDYIKKTGSTEYGTAEEEAAEMEYLTELVNKYKSFTSYWEIGNEQNLAWLDSGRDSAKLENYAKHLRDCYNTIKAADPNATVILGGLSEYYAEDWVSAFADITVDGQPAYKYCDEAAFHPYAETPDRQNERDGSVERVRAFVSAMKTSWGTDMPVWITEVGFHATASWDINKAPGKVASEDIKAEYLTEVMNKIHAELGEVQRPVMWYILHEVGNGDIAGYGLTKKKIYEYGVSKTELAAYTSMKNLVTVKASAADLPISDTFAEAAGTIPEGWTSNLGENNDAKYVSISNEAMLDNTGYMRVHKNDGESWEEVQADREFKIPEGGALINISFDYLVMCDSAGYGKKILLMNDDTTGVIIEHKYEAGANSVVLTDKDGLGGENYPATVIGDEVREWRHFNFTINCSDSELGGLPAGYYTLSYNNNEAITGKIRDGLTSLNKIRFTSAVGKNSDTCIDNLNITVEDLPGVLEISSASAVGGKAVINFNSTKSTAKGDIIIAAYEDGVFSRMAYMQQGYLFPKGASSIEVSLGDGEAGETYKVFVWDSMNSLKPVMNCKSF